LKPAPFAYHRPETLEDAFALWAAGDGDAVWLAGGQSLIPAMAMRLNQPSALIDLARIPSLRGVTVEGNMVRIGAMTRYADLIAHPAVAAALPLMATALPHIAHTAIRNRGTIGGSLALSDPAAEMPAVTLVLDAVMTIAGPDGTRQVAAQDFTCGLYETALQPGEMLTRIDIPVQSPAPFAFREVARRQGDYALAGLAAIGGAAPRIVWFGFSTHARRDAPAEAALAAGADAATIIAAALDGIDIMGDSVTGEDTRAHLARVLLTRVLTDWGIA
jgi:carbon-monoxide dehydrogenase medium subunit